MKFRFLTGIFNPKGERPKFSTTMFCGACEYTWEASRTDGLCPICADRNVIPISGWPNARAGIPKLTLINGGQSCGQ